MPWSPERSVFPSLRAERQPPTLSTFRRPELILRPPHDLSMAAPQYAGEQTPARREGHERHESVQRRYEFPSFLRDLEARRLEVGGHLEARGREMSPPAPAQGPPPPTHFVSDVSLTGARGKLASLV